MDIEYEATFESVDKGQLRSVLASAGAHLLKKEFLQKRTVFSLPKSVRIIERYPFLKTTILSIIT
jgi:hypothetical protein